MENKEKKENPVVKDHDYYVAIGRKGGLSTKRNKGREHYIKIGQKGGNAPHNYEKKETLTDE